MASLPARRPSQRRQSPTENSQTPSSQSQTSPSRTRSEDSQTIFVNRPQEEEHQEQGEDPADDPNVKKCWVCYSDSTEDTPETSIWRDPCPCALVAHEQCLLDWIADMEAPRHDRNGGVTGRKIECPQCKSEIKLARPRDFLVEAVRLFERWEAKMVVPAAAYFTFRWLYAASLYWGMQSIQDVFGSEDAGRILRPETRYYPTPDFVIETLGENIGNWLWQGIVSRGQHWRLKVGVPLIPPVLVLSRTRLADGVLPVLPIVFFASQVHSPTDAVEFASWPPSASFAFALLPYVRGTYNACYRALFAEKEKRWMKEIQARREPEGENVDADDNDNEMEVQIDEGIWDDWNDGEPEGGLANVPPQPVDEDEGAPAPNVQDNRPIPGAATAARAPVRVAEDENEDEGAPAPNVQANRPVPNGGANEAPAQPQPQAQAGQPQQQQANQANHGLQRRFNFSITAIAESVIGALLFPRIADIAGQVLGACLPSSWTRPPAASWFWNGRHEPKAFFANKWARSLVGGCLFVVCKDAMMLYVRWKMVQMHRSRRVLDFDRSRAAES